MSTKRNILSLIAKYYNPVSLIQTIIIKLNLLSQNVCSTNVDWDSEIEGQLCYFYDVEPRDYIVSYQLHGFCDAY